MKKLIGMMTVALGLWGIDLHGQNVGINPSGANPDASSTLDIVSTNKGLLIPRVALTATNSASPISSPTTSLLIYNTATAGTSPNNVVPGFYYWNGSKWITFTSDGSLDWALSGNAGTVSGTNFIGTIDNQALDIRTNNTLRTRVTTKGQLEVLNTGGSIFIGEGAGANDDLSTNINVFVGTLSGNQTTTGSGNVGVGYLTLEDNTIGVANVGIGNSALSSNISGGSNVGIGSNALLNNTTGDSNVGLGTNSLEANTTGGENTGLGTRSLFNNTTGSENVAVGVHAMQTNVSGRNNTAVGVNSLFTSSIGDENVAIGRDALKFTTSNSNTAAGYHAGITNTTGANNTYFGYLADGTAAGLSNSTAIGYLAKVAASNSLVLGATGVNAVNVGIGTTAPGADLHLSGSAAAIRLEDESAPVGAISRTMSGVELVTQGNTTTSTYTSGIKFMSSDPSFTTENPKLLAGIFPMATQNYNADDRGGMALNFATTDNTAGTSTVPSIRMTITESGRVGIGTTSPTKNIEINASSPGIQLTDPTTGTPHINFNRNGPGLNWQIGSDAPTNSFYIYQAGNYYFSVKNSTGRVGVGTFNPGGQFELSQDQGRKPSTNTWTTTSDSRLKNITGSYEKGLEEVLKLNPITYYYKNVGERKFTEEVLNNLNIGFSAQEVREIFPEAVGVDDDGYLNFNMHSIIVAYTNAIKEQQEIIENQKVKIELLQADNEKQQRINNETNLRLKLLEEHLKTTSK